MSHRTGLSRGVLLLALLCAVSFGAIVRVALAGDNYHVTCVEHGFYAGGDGNDGSFFSRVYQGCGSTDRICSLYDGTNPGSPSFIGSTETFNTTGTCNTWSRDYGTSYPECVSFARLTDPAAFSAHNHAASTPC